MTAQHNYLVKALEDFASGVAPRGDYLEGFQAGALGAARHARGILECEDIPKVGPCAGCQYHEINRPDGAACAAGECIEQEA